MQAGTDVQPTYDGVSDRGLRLGLRICKPLLRGRQLGLQTLRIRSAADLPVPGFLQQPRNMLPCLPPLLHRAHSIMLKLAMTKFTRRKPSKRRFSLSGGNFETVHALVARLFVMLDAQRRQCLRIMLGVRHLPAACAALAVHSAAGRSMAKVVLPWGGTRWRRRCGQLGVAAAVQVQRQVRLLQPQLSLLDDQRVHLAERLHACHQVVICWTCGCATVWHADVTQSTLLCIIH